jgi:tetratricopeptide (TPR) repeat protein
MDLALVAPSPAEKAVRLASVTRVLDSIRNPHAVQAAAAAARWAERARQESAPPSGDEQDAEEATREAAVALITVGELRQGRELLDSLRASPAAGDAAGSTVVARAALAARPYDPALAEELLDQAERYAEELAEGSPADPSAPVSARAAIAAAADGARAARMWNRISVYTQAFPSRLLACAVDASAASALASVRPQQANPLAEQAARRLETALGDPDTLPTDDRSDLAILLGPMLTAVVQALADTGSVDHARAVVACVPEKRHTGLIGMDTLANARTVIAEYLDDPDEDPSAQALAQQAYRLADDNQPDEARQRLHQALEAVGSPPLHGAPPRETWLISLCTALSAIGRHGESAHLAGSLRDPAQQVQALAAAAVSARRPGTSMMRDGWRTRPPTVPGHWTAPPTSPSSTALLAGMSPMRKAPPRRPWPTQTNATGPWPSPPRQARRITRGEAVSTHLDDQVTRHSGTLEVRTRGKTRPGPAKTAQQWFERRGHGEGLVEHDRGRGRAGDDGCGVAL